MKALVYALAIVTGCTAQRQVERRYDGELVEGRLISSESYAHYARGALLQAEGRLVEAADEYRSVIVLDRNSVSAWTQLGACLCALGRASDEAFERALRLGPGYARAWHERARCLERRGAYARAATAAEHALRLDPDQFEYTQTLAHLLERLGDDERARQLLVGAALWQPGSVAPRLALAELAIRKHDMALLRMSCCLTSDAEPFPIASPPADRPESRPGTVPPTNAGVTPRAAVVPIVERALCAAARGDGAEAVRLSRVVLDADADNADAWVALIYGADLIQDADAANDACVRIGARPRITYQLARDLLTEVLARRSGPAAAAAWQGAWDSESPERSGLPIDCERQRALVGTGGSRD